MKEVLESLETTKKACDELHRHLKNAEGVVDQLAILNKKKTELLAEVDKLTLERESLRELVARERKEQIQMIEHKEDALDLERKDVAKLYAEAKSLETTNQVLKMKYENGIEEARKDKEAAQEMLKKYNQKVERLEKEIRA